MARFLTQLMLARRMGLAIFTLIMIIGLTLYLKSQKTVSTTQEFAKVIELIDETPNVAKDNYRVKIELNNGKVKEAILYYRKPEVGDFVPLVVNHPRFGDPSYQINRERWYSLGK